MPKVYLLSRTLDPMLGLFTGLLAYYLHETNPRSAPPPGHSLRELVSWKWGVTRERRAMKDLHRDTAGSGSEVIDGVEWERVRRELEGEARK